VRLSAFALVALLMAGCSSMPTQPAQPDAQAFQTKFLNLASISDQVGNITNVAPNTQVYVPIQVAPITQISALSWGSQNATPVLGLEGYQGIDTNTSQLLDQLQHNQ
jgi:hypothetical protein